MFHVEHLITYLLIIFNLFVCFYYPFSYIYISRKGRSKTPKTKLSLCFKGTWKRRTSKLTQPKRNTAQGQTFKARKGKTSRLRKGTQSTGANSLETC